MISDLFSLNYKIIERKTQLSKNAEQKKVARFQIKNGFCPRSGNYQLTESRENTPGLIALKGNEKTTIHSNYYPIKEAEKIVQGFNSQKQTIVILGMGLGYIIPLLIEKYPTHKIIVVEADKHLFNLALHYLNLENLSENVFFVVGYEYYETSDLVRKIAEEYDLLEFRSVESLFPDYYSGLKKRLSGKSGFSVSGEWKYPKFAKEKCNVIFIDSSYVLSRECITGLQSLGHNVRYLHIEQQEMDYSVFIHNFLQVINEFRPDFVLTINHLGFDRGGRLTELLSDMEIPFASWYVDSPTIVLQSYETNISPFCNIFVWDRDYIPDLKKIGYHQTDYLPLATMPSVFRPLNLEKEYNVSFVGSSMVFGIHKNMRSFIHRQDLLFLLDKTADKFLQSDSRYVADSIKELEESGTNFRFEDTEQRADFEAAVLWRATQIYRLSGIKKLGDFYPMIFGDPNWDRFLDNRYRIGREALYYEDLPTVYNKSALVFNMTSCQMKNSVNQRVFDVPACGSFLLTDYKKQLEEIFEIGKEIVTFNEIDEITELVKYYSKNSTEREKIAKAAYKKILNNETYEHRLTNMISIMKNRYKNL
ncbi:MAG: glycosyltransferase [Candidatus Cloacimonetes bacterium]|nr:glycosyltransferase [Candidatus Cloacimonadota bacterium]